MATKEDLPGVSVQRLYQRHLANPLESQIRYMAEKTEPYPNEICGHCGRAYEDHDQKTRGCPLQTTFHASGRFYPPKQ